MWSDCQAKATWKSSVASPLKRGLVISHWCEEHATILKRSPNSAADQWEKLPSSKDE